MSTVILASPIVKIFHEKYARACVDDPSLIFDPDTPFQVTIPTSTGALGPFPYMVPVDLNQLPGLKRFEKEESGTPRFRIIMEWLCSQYSADAAHHETDQYGIVAAVGTGADMSAMLMQKLMMERKLKTLKEKPSDNVKVNEAIQDLQSRILDVEMAVDASANNTQELAVNLAHKRVMRHVRGIWRRMRTEWQRLDEMKQQRLIPSFTEICVMTVLEKEIQADNSRNAKINDRIKNLSVALSGS